MLGQNAILNLAHQIVGQAIKQALQEMLDNVQGPGFALENPHGPGEHPQKEAIRAAMIAKILELLATQNPN